MAQAFSGRSCGPGRLSPRRTTCARPGGTCLPWPIASAPALCESSRPVRARQAPVRSKLCAATSLVTAAWRRGRGRPPLRLHPRNLGGPRVDGLPCDHGVVTKGDAPQLCGLGSGRGPVRALRSDLVIELGRPICQLALGKTGAPWTTGGVLHSVGLLVRTTAYVLCTGTLCWPCVAPCSSKADRLDDGAGSLPAEHYGGGTEAF